MRETYLIPLAAGVALAVAACTSVEPYGAVPATAAASSTLYCWKDRLVDQQDRLVCNWAPTRYDACHGHVETYVEKRLVTAQPAPATRCENGQSLVYITTG